MTDRGLDPAPIKAVLFDAVGTLLRPRPAVAVAYQEHGRRFGSRLSVDQIERRFRAAFARQENADPVPGDSSAETSPTATSPACERRRWQSIVAEVFADVPNAEGALFESLWQHFADSRHWALYDDAAAAWQYLAARGLIVGIASNFDDRLLSVCAGHPPLAGARHVFFSAGIGHSKPSPEFFAAIERELGLSGREILLVGDDVRNDLAGARAAGWQSLLVDRAGTACVRGALRSLTQLVPLWPAPAAP